ncbi:MAG: methyltransferase domain-containing protein [Acidobacteriia bacterium]|nr:methyltransferase domain-containing protein [Terriglobia bacterium]
MKAARIIQTELLDGAPPSIAEHNLRDLVRINRYFGGHRIMRGLLASVAPATPFTVLDIGAAGGDHARAIRSWFPQATVTSLDCNSVNLGNAPPPRLLADATRLPFDRRSFDFVTSALFLHHFPDAQIVEMLASFHQTARRALIVSDLERNRLAYYTLPATGWLFGWSPITLYDGPVSVQASFRKRELADLARQAGLHRARIRRHIPWCRLSLLAPR